MPLFSTLGMVNAKTDRPHSNATAQARSGHLGPGAQRLSGTVWNRKRDFPGTLFQPSDRHKNHQRSPSKSPWFQKAHSRLCRCLARLAPVASLACRDEIIQPGSASLANGDDMVDVQGLSPPSTVPAYRLIPIQHPGAHFGRNLTRSAYICVTSDRPHNPCKQPEGQNNQQKSNP